MMRSRILTAVLLVFVLLVGTVFVRAADVNIVADSKNIFEQVQIFADALSLIYADYVKPVKARDLVYGAVRGMMKSLDGYSQFLDPESFKEITEDTKGQFCGVGIEIGMRDGMLTVITPIDGTPAFNAGLQSGDMVVKIDGEITRDMTLGEAVRKMRGDVGTEVHMTVIRADTEEILEFSIVRALIRLKSIEHSRIIDDAIGYVRILEFQQRTAKELKERINALKSDGAKSLILDIRNNPGGLFASAVEAADLFLEPGAMIVYTEGRDPAKRTEFKAGKVSEFNGMNVAVLVNGGSASAAEILAGALKDNKRAVLVGTPTFGKGSVQTVIPLEDRSALRLTTAAYYTPSGKNLMDKGVEPNIHVERVKAAVEPSETVGMKDEKEEKVNRKKEGIFKRIKGKEKVKESKKKESPEEYDNQVQAAVNVLRGVRVFEEYRDAGK